MRLRHIFELRVHINTTNKYLCRNTVLILKRIYKFYVSVGCWILIFQVNNIFLSPMGGKYCCYSSEYFEQGRTPLKLAIILILFLPLNSFKLLLLVALVIKPIFLQCHQQKKSTTIAHLNMQPARQRRLSSICLNLLA